MRAEEYAGSGAVSIFGRGIVGSTAAPAVVWRAPAPDSSRKPKPFTLALMPNGRGRRRGRRRLHLGRPRSPNHTTIDASRGHFTVRVQDFNLRMVLAQRLQASQRAPCGGSLASPAGTDEGLSSPGGRLAGTLAPPLPELSGLLPTPLAEMDGELMVDS